VRSRPIYSPVEKHPHSAMHLFISQGNAPDAMQSIFDQCDPKKSQIHSHSSIDDLSFVFREALPALPLATTFYLAGSESFLWGVAAQLYRQGVLQDQIRMLAPETKSRNVFCCHCYTITENVDQSPVSCAGCHRTQEVTDHFSRHLGAYRGCQVNAEDPLDLPKSMELS
jgi:hypothetical protein